MRESEFDHLFWKETSRRKSHELGLFDVYSVERTSAGGASGSFVVLDLPDWVTIIPRLEGDPATFLMVRQFRHGSGRITVEFPAGVMQRGEAVEHAARRELLEETGYRAGRLTLLVSLYPNPAFMNNQLHVYLADALELVQEPRLDDLELLDVERVPASELGRGVGASPFDNGVMMIALAAYERQVVADRDRR